MAFVCDTLPADHRQSRRDNFPVRYERAYGRAQYFVCDRVIGKCVECRITERVDQYSAIRRTYESEEIC
jgi:hypothetical protein